MTFYACLIALFLCLFSKPTPVKFLNTNSQLLSVRGVSINATLLCVINLFQAQYNLKDAFELVTHCVIYAVL